MMGAKQNLLSDTTLKPTSWINCRMRWRGIPRSCFDSPSLGFLQSPIEIVGSLSNTNPPALAQRYISLTTLETLGIWWRTLKQVIRSKVLSGKGMDPSGSGSTYCALIAGRRFSEDSRIVTLSRLSIIGSNSEPSPPPKERTFENLRLGSL